MIRKIDKKFIKYVYKDVYKAPEVVISILKEEGLTEKQITKYMRKRDKYLNRKFKRKTTGYQHFWDTISGIPRKKK